MRTNIALASAALLLLAGQAHAADEAVGFGPIPRWADLPEPMPVPENARGIAFVRYQDSEAHLDKSGEQDFHAYRVKVLHQNALQLGNVALSWNPASGKPVVHRMIVHRDGTERDVLATESFTILQREGGLEAAMITGMLTAILRIPDLRVGDELEIAYTLPAHDPTLRAESSGLLFLAADPAPGRFHLGLSWEEGQEPHVRITPDLEPSVTRNDRSLLVQLDMPEAVSVPKDAPPRFNWQRVVEFTDFPEWQALSRRFAPLYSHAAKLPDNSPIKGEAARIAAAHPGARGRMEAALKLVQQQVRYIYVGLDGGNYTPVSASKTWEQRYGDCKGKTALLLALLTELGISAEAVLASNSGADDGLEARLPAPGSFDHVLVRATIDGEKFWLDGTLPPVALASVRPIMPYLWVLPLSDAGAALEQIPWQPPMTPTSLTLHEIDLRESIDGPATLTDTTITRGPSALIQYVQYSSLTEGQLESAFRQELEGGSYWDTIEKVSWRFDQATQASVMEIKGTGPLDWDIDDDGSRSLALPGGGFSPPPRRQRSSGQNQSAPYYNAPKFDCDVTTVRLPEDTSLWDWHYNSWFRNEIYGGLYSRRFELHDGALRMIRSFQTQQTEIDPAVAAQDNARLADFDNSKAMLSYEPERTTAFMSPHRVPSTYELDWVADGSACITPGLEPEPK